MLSHPYFPHALFALALTSVSLNFVSHRKSSEDERSRVMAQISILESIRDQLKSDQPLANDELERLKKLARPSPMALQQAGAQVTDEVSWRDIFKGRKPVVGEVSKWDQQELDKLKRDMEASR